MPGNDYKLSITLKKFGIAYITSFIGVMIPFSIGFIRNYEWSAEAIIYIPLVIAGLIALENAWKHFNDNSFKTIDKSAIIE